ncbi:MAG: DCC1-like thiol-disulfide oxidoreductase family protein, partial [Candidatus Binatia bacterium]
MLIILITAVFILVGGALYFTFGSRFVESAHGRLFLSRIFVICLALYGIFLFIVLRDYFFPVVKEFFSATAAPINLAVFRIIVFSILFLRVSGSFNRIIWYSQVPPEFRIAPVGLKWILDFLPINETWATVACIMLLVFSLTAMVGFFTRTSAWITVIAGVYALGIPELFGKVDHYHHLVWFPAILAASRCGDVFSVDAVMGAWRRADHGLTEPPEASNAYALPLRFVWLLIGIMYFFPGFAKLWTSGFDWALSDNIKYLMYDKWDYPHGWMPFFRIDQYPVLYRLGGIATIVFEMSFIFLIFFPSLRIFAVAGGFAFHTMTELFLRISFRDLLRCYVVFFDWNMIFRRIGTWLYREPRYVIYDGNCSRCRRTIASLRVFDIFGRLTYVNAHDKESIREHGLLWLDASAIMTDLYVVTARKQGWPGFFGYRILAARIPILWPIWPLLYVWPITAIGTRLYRHVADSR